MIIKEVKKKMSTVRMCLCWLDEDDCQFQRHLQSGAVICESYEIWQLCVRKKELNRGYD